MESAIQEITEIEPLKAYSTRRIGAFGGKQPGPLVIAVGGIHGNEPAGVNAIQEIFQMLHVETAINPEFQFQGKLVGLIGNKSAFDAGLRYIDHDLNRAWHPHQIALWRHRPAEALTVEQTELLSLIEAIRHEILAFKPDTLIIVDLHTTSAQDGVFSIPLEYDPESLLLASSLRAPVVLGLLEGINGGTLLHYAAGNHFKTGLYPTRTECVAFEAGQHHDPKSVSRAITAVINLLKTVGCFDDAEVNHRHEEVLHDYSRQLPQITRIRYVHHIQPDMAFKMRPGYANFQPISAGEHLADDINGRVLAPSDGRILMPLYQPQGADGFFVVEDVD